MAPLLLLPGLLEFVAREAELEDFLIGRYSESEDLLAREKRFRYRRNLLSETFDFLEGK